MNQYTKLYYYIYYTMYQILFLLKKYIKMLRNSYINKYKEKSKYDPDDKFLKEDEEYLLKNIRPLPERTIRNLPQRKLNQFVEDVMTNQKVTYVLYSTNAKNEIHKYIKSKEVLEQNSTKSKVKKSKNEPSDIVKRRIRREAFGQIKQAVDEFQAAKKQKKEELTAKNNILYYSLKKEMASERNRYFEPAKQNRIKEFTKSFNDIKNKLNALKGREPKTTSETEETYTQIVNKPFYTESSKVNLPEMKLDINNVYSRLYKNAVLLSDSTVEENKKKRIAKRNSIANKELPKTNSKNKNQQQQHQRNTFRLKNVLKSTNGKEFTIRLSDDMINRCFLKYSGGPKAISLLKAQIEEEKENQTELPEDQVNFINLKDKDGNSFLHLVTIEDIPELAKYFIEKGSNINLKNNDGDTPLHIAMRYKYKEIIDLLLSNGARIDIANNSNEIVYDLASSEMKKKYGMDKEMMYRQSKKKK